MSTPNYSEVARQVIAGLIPAPAGSPAMTVRTLPGSGIEVTAPARLLEGITAAAGLGRAVRDRLEEYIGYARGDGWTWEDIDASMARPGASPVAGAGFAAVATDLGDGLSAGWMCASCGRAVTDYGPAAVPGETGHWPGCLRAAAAIAAQEAQREDDSDG